MFRILTSRKTYLIRYVTKILPTARESASGWDLLQAPLQGACSFLGVPSLTLEKDLNPVIILATSIQDTDLLRVLREKSLPQNP